MPNEFSDCEPLVPDDIFEDAHDQEFIRQQMDELQERYRHSLKSQVMEISQAWRRLSSAVEWTEEMAQLVSVTIDKTHRLAGSAGSFGYVATSELAAPMEYVLRHILENKTFPGIERARQVEVLVSELVASVDEESALHYARPVPGRKRGTEAGRVYLISRDLEDAMGMARRIGHFSYEVTVFDDLNAAARAIEEQPPAATLVDLTGFEKQSDALALVERYQPYMPVLIVVDADDFDTRLMVAKAGGKGFLLKPVDAEELLVWLDRLTGRVPDNPFEVLIIDDDVALAQCYAVILGQAGMRADVLEQPRHILDVLSASQPDIILIDVFMRDMSGIDLAKVIRQQQHLLAIPIIFLVSSDDKSHRYQALIHGGNDIIEKPVTPTELTLAVANRAARSRSLRAVMERDSLTGLLNHRMVKERLAQEVDRAHRLNRPLSFVLLDLDNFKQVNDTYGHVAGDNVLKSLAKFLQSRLRKTDIIGRYGGEEFAVVMTDSSEENAIRVMNEVREGFGAVAHTAGDKSFNVTLSCGVRAVEDKDDTPETMLLIADERLYAAKESGRDRVWGRHGDSTN